MKFRHIISWVVVGATPADKQKNIEIIIKQIRLLLDKHEVAEYDVYIVGPSLGFFPATEGGQDMALTVDFPHQDALKDYYALLGTESGKAMGVVVRPLVVSRAVTDMRI